jgi:hypothetical protein
MNINGSKIDFNNPTNTYDITGTNDPDNVGKLIIYRDNGYDTGYDTQPVTGHDAKTRGEKGPNKLVQLYSKAGFDGKMFEIKHGNYTSDVFVSYLIPSNVFSLTIPPRTTVKLYCGDKYDFGGKGGMSITNTSLDIMRVNTLPQNIAGHIRSISIISHSIDKSGKVKTESETESEYEDEKNAVIISDRGDVIVSGLNTGLTSQNNLLEPFDNNKLCTYTNNYVFYLCLIIIMYLIYNSR